MGLARLAPTKDDSIRRAPKRPKSRMKLDDAITILNSEISLITVFKIDYVFCFSINPACFQKIRFYPTVLIVLKSKANSICFRKSCESFILEILKHSHWDYFSLSIK